MPRKRVMVPLSLAIVPGMRGVMSRGVWLVDVMCVCVCVCVFIGARVDVEVEVPSPLRVGGGGGGGLEQTISTVWPVLSSRVRMVRRACSSRATMAPARQMYWMGWLLRKYIFCPVLGRGEGVLVQLHHRQLFVPSLSNGYIDSAIDACMHTPSPFSFRDEYGHIPSNSLGCVNRRKSAIPSFTQVKYVGAALWQYRG